MCTCQTTNDNSCNSISGLLRIIQDLKSPISGEIDGNEILLIRNNEVIGKIPDTFSASTIVFVDAFGQAIPNL